MCQLRHTWKTELVVRIEAVVVSGLLLDHALYQKLGDGIPTCRSLCLPRAGKTQCPDTRCRQRFNRNRAGADSNLRLADLAGYVATRWANVLRLQGVADLLALGWPGSC